MGNHLEEGHWTGVLPEMSMLTPQASSSPHRVGTGGRVWRTCRCNSEAALGREGGETCRVGGDQRVEDKHTGQVRG